MAWVGHDGNILINEGLFDGACVQLLQATVGKAQSTINVVCHPEDAGAEMVANMTGYARIYCERSSLAGYVSHRVWRYFRTEIWW